MTDCSNMHVATIEKVVSVREHPNADLLQIATILGWDVVCKKQDCQKDELVVFINIDSVVDPHPFFHFLKAKSYQIKPIKIRGYISQGLIVPIKDLQHFGFTKIQELSIGSDVSKIVGAKHYEEIEPSRTTGKSKGLFPSFLFKTNENNLRNFPLAIEEIKDKEVYITQKIDGTSATFYVKSGRFGVCSRTLDLQEDENHYWNMVKKYDLAFKMLNFDDDIAIQGEIYGPSIQNNSSGIKQISFAAFNIFDIKRLNYGSLQELTDFCSTNDIPQAKIIYRGKMNFELKDLIRMASEQFYDNNNPCEGIVIRTVEPINSKCMALNRWSAKVLNENYDI